MLKNTLILISLLVLFGCRKDPIQREFESEYFIVLVVDGPRKTESWNDPAHANIPRIVNQLAPLGSVFTNFRCEGPTYTNAGHTAILTGHYQEIDNSGAESPDYPNYMAIWRDKFNADSTDAWIITSKDKLEALADTKHSDWAGVNLPMTDCGINGNGTGYRDDTTTVQHVIDTLSKYHPHQVLINLRQPDFYGHTGDWSKYVLGLKSSDEHCYEIWNFIQNDPIYKDKTTLIITNDHGRHSDEFGGFAHHGDNCEGCRDIFCYAFGPDISAGTIIDKEYEQIDIPVTISYMLGYRFNQSDGKVMYEMFK